MANYVTLKAAIQAAIKQNGDNEITGNLLQVQLLSMINLLGSGYQFMGIATPSTNPGTPDYNGFYFALTEGTYTHFNNIEVAGGELAILLWNGNWAKFSAGVTEETLLNRYFIGKGDTFSDTKLYGLRPGRRYKVILPPESKWDMSGVTITGDVNRFAISNWYNGAWSNLGRVTMEDTLPDSLIFTVPENTDYVAIGGRATSGKAVYFMVIDITDMTILINGGFDVIPDYPISGLLMNRYFIGKGNSIVNTKLYGLRPGRRYQVVLPPESKWDMSGVTTDGSYNRFVVNSYYNGVATPLAKVEIRDTLPGSLNFTVPDNCEYILLGGRAANNAVIMFGVVDITNITVDISLINGGFDVIPDYPISGLLMNRYFIGKGDTFSDTKLYGLRPGRRYQVVLPPGTKWDMSGVTSLYNRFAVSNWYGGSHTSLAYVLTGDSLPAYVNFTVPENSDYVAIGGRAAVGAVVPFMVVDITDTWKREKLEVAKKKVTTGCGNQGLTKVGNKIIQFNSAADDHSEYANLLIWNAADYAVQTNMRHNLGHAATADYNEDADALIVGNGSSDVTVAPRIDIVTNAAAKIVPGQRLSYNDNDNIHIELKTSLKEIGGSGLICTFGGNWRIVYLATGQNAPRKIFRCILGVGSEDFSDPTGTDVTRWGTFISGKSDSEYNGTLKVLSTYLGDETEVFQGMCYRNGHIYLACGYTTPLVHKIALYTDGFKIVQTNLPINYAANGNEIACEPEGLCFVDENTMLVGLPVYGGLFQIDAF